MEARGRQINRKMFKNTEAKTHEREGWMKEMSKESKARRKEIKKGAIQET